MMYTTNDDFTKDKIEGYSNRKHMNTTNIRVGNISQNSVTVKHSI